MENQVEPFGFQVTLADPYETAVAKVTAALKEEGFGVLTEIDVKATLKKKLDVDFRKYTILGACNPPLAHSALSTQLEIGLMLPCNVLVYEADDGGTVVSLTNPMMMLSMGQMAGLRATAEEATTRLQRVQAALQG